MVLSVAPFGDFRDVDVYPTPDEILGKCVRPFRANVTRGAYKNVEDYLDVQFRLLREDFVANLRKALAEYRSQKKTKDIEVYKDVTIRKDRNNLKIDLAVNDEEKKFMNGSLLLFTTDNFKSVSLAKVAQRVNGRDEVIIEMIDSNIGIQRGYTMAECSQYFDPYFNILTALQSFSVHSFPMEKYIVGVDTSSVHMPPYLHKPLSYEIEGRRFAPELIPRLNSALGLNPAQLRAFKAALTQEFVVIQGPPGTGKTHLGVKIASTLVQNSHFWYSRTPLLIVAHKNDALDQFLEGLLSVTQRLVRVGSQSKSDKLKAYNLANDSSRGGVTRRRPREEYRKVLQGALVVGMTTSIAARWRDHVEALKSPIVIVEEAAEILEGHVVAALTHHCQHLILMGDHQQLQPISADHNIGKEHQLGVSLFERMVLNQVQHFQLNTQHRMRPDISDLLKVKIYTFLQDHDSVKSRPDIRGVTKNVFFLDHQYPEETVNHTSKKNEFEARFLLLFARYLVLNGYNSGEVVILATYSAQVQELESLIAKEPSVQEAVRISTLDGFQGQESDIVLLSLVRSDEIGFLGKENRVCVALSRAKNGFYIVGNMSLLARRSRLWATIKNCLAKQKALGTKLTLRCQKHQNLTDVSSKADFLQIPNGGCTVKCGSALWCGHVCTLRCHNDGMKHQCERKCKEPEKVVRARTNLWTPPSTDLWTPPSTNVWTPPVNYHYERPRYPIIEPSPGIITRIFRFLSRLWNDIF